MCKVTYVQKYYDSRLFELAKESGNVYSKALVFFHKVLRKKKIWLSPKELARYIENTVERKQLHSQSYQASYQKLFDNIKAFSKAKKEWIKNPSKFLGQPRLTRKRKFFQPIQFKKSAIRYKDGFIMLSLAKGIESLKIRWNEKVSIPSFVSINWNSIKKYWQVNLVIEKENNVLNLDINKTMAIDLGIKRIATTYNSKESITYSGKKVKSLTIGRNKINSESQIKLSKLKKGSNKYKRLRRSNRKVNLRIDNKIKDILHKTSKTIVNQAIKENIGKIAIGDCSDIHNNTSCGKINNQQIQQNPEQRLLKYIEYKFNNIGGTVAIVPENYTSQTCPNCQSRHKPQNRVYKCPTCNFKDDRDIVGAKNIYKVSFGLDIKSKLDVIGFLTKPIGWKYKTNRDCKIAL